jgi:GMP synthase (glutamine-hydrolysing)
MDSLAILDFGSQYSQLIARRVREANVYCELFPFDAPESEVMAIRPKGFILSGGPASVFEPAAPRIPQYVLDSGLPILGICYGMQALTHQLGGQVERAQQREYGPATVRVEQANPLLPPGEHPVWMSHGDRIEHPPPGFIPLASSPNSPYAAIAHPQRRIYGVQFHPEVQHTPGGFEILRRFALHICGARPEWTPPSIVRQAVEDIRRQVGQARAIAAVSGGVDSTVAASLVHRAIGERLVCIFVDNGLLRAGEAATVGHVLGDLIGAELIQVDASERFFKRLRGVSDPEKKRRIIGETFIQVFAEQAASIPEARFLVQGTIYPDVVESRGPERQKAARIKTHHNVGGLPQNLPFDLVEPLRFLFKDEVRRVGAELGLPEDLLWRQPFPGPGLAVRCLGQVTPERIARLRKADSIFLEELDRADLLREGTAQAFAVLLPVRSVGVMGDERTYGETLALRAVTTEDFMTADWARLPPDLLARASTRIVNEVSGITRVVYDITSKPPATIEWE